MHLLVRKIDYAKWGEPPEGFDSNQIQADAITSNLRTHGNRMSLWRCSSAEESEIDKVVLALSTKTNGIGKIDVAWLRSTEVADEGFELEESPGDTKVRSLRKEHADIVNLDMMRLERIATMLSASIKEGNYQRRKPPETRAILARAVSDGLVSLDNLEEKTREEVAKHLGEAA